ncbi:hypothetical protein PT276_06470 [Orbaceae bacterium ESL0721]|nr:hypothetical protein [Orbaceae bacterium ESL0721]
MQHYREMAIQIQQRDPTSDFNSLLTNFTQYANGKIIFSAESEGVGKLCKRC